MCWPQEKVEADVADLVAGKQALHGRIWEFCRGIDGFTVQRSEVTLAVDRFFSALFSQYGSEVAHVLLSAEGGTADLDSVLDPDRVAAILAEVLKQWQPIQGNAFRRAISQLLIHPSGPGLLYLNALSESYVCMQLLNIDPKGVNIQRDRVVHSTAVLDTDVVLSGIVQGADRERVSRTIAESCKAVGMACMVMRSSIEEIVFRVQKSIMLYEDLGEPTFIPAEKREFVHDLFLDIYFGELAAGRVKSFSDYIKTYYDPADPAGHIENLIQERLGVPVENPQTYYIQVQDKKVRAIKETIERSRTDSLSYKNEKLYENDALVMVIVEQQNRLSVTQGSIGRWYLVSSDRHILNAYLKHKTGFGTKPCILPIFFLELLRRTPEVGADEATFGSILQSEAMLRGAGKNYAPLIGALSKLGIEVLSLPTARLKEMLDDMERADLAHWLVRLRVQPSVPPEVLDEIRRSLKAVLEETASRTHELKRLQQLQEKAVHRK